METVLKIKDLTVTYPQRLGREKIALNGLNLEIGRSQTFGLLGPNGAGKTTLIKSIMGLIRIKKGSVSIFGDTSLSAKVKSRLGYMPEIANYYWFLNSEEILHIFGALCGMEKKKLKNRIDYILDIVGLAGEKRQWIKDFSKGMQVRLNIAQALLHDPDLLILDEPFSGLDPLGRIDIRNILKALKDRGKTILLSSHELSEAEMICDYVCIMKKGAILKYGSLAGLLEERKEHSLEQYFINIIGGKGDE